MTAQKPHTECMAPHSSAPLHCGDFLCKHVHFWLRTDRRPTLDSLKASPNSPAAPGVWRRYRPEQAMEQCRRHWLHLVGFGPGQVPTFLYRAAHSGVLPSCMGKMVPCPAVQSDFGGLMPRVCMVRGFLEETHRILCPTGGQDASGLSHDSRVSRGPYQGD